MQPEPKNFPAHTDRSRHDLSGDYAVALETVEITCSMSRGQDCRGNATARDPSGRSKSGFAHRAGLAEQSTGGGAIEPPQAGSTSPLFLSSPSRGD